MDWQKLDLAKASVLKREVDVVLQKLYDTNPEVNKSRLCTAVQFRIQELENFCAVNGDDERIILFQKECLRLRKALQSQSRDGKSVNTADRSTSPTGTPSTSNKLYNTGGKSISQGAEVAVSSTASVHSTRTMSTANRPSNGNSLSPTPQGGRSQVGSRSNANSSMVGTDLRSTYSHAQPIYSWEESNERAERVPIDMGGTVFLPSKQVGFYNRQDVVEAGYDSTALPEKHVDFQIILSPEELTTLAARKRAASTRLAAQKGATPSLHSSTPYIDPRRIYKDHLRPNNPDRWISAEGLRPAYRRTEKF